MEKAYSVFQIKAVDEDARIITGIATTPATDRHEDIVESKGANYQLPIPFLWQHDREDPIGHVTKVSVRDSEIEVEVQLVKTDEPGELKNLLDKAWQSIKLRLVRGLSIGFKPKEWSDIAGTWGVRYTKWDWLELSAVTIPANAEATISTIKAAIGRKSLPGVTGIYQSQPRIKARAAPITRKEDPVNIEEQIKALEASRQAKAAQMHDIQSKAGEAGRGKDEAEREEFETLDSEIKAIDRELTDLRVLQKLDAATAKPVTGKSVDDGHGSRTPHVTIRPNQAKDGLALAQVVKCLGRAQGNRFEAAQLAESAKGALDPRVPAVLKAAVAVGSTTNAPWAGNLVGDETSVYADFVEFLRPLTIIGKFGTGGIPSLRRVPFRTPLLGQSSGGDGYWVGEGKGKPVTKFDFTRTTLEPLKVANIAVVTEELLRDSSPSADALIRDQLVAALRERLDLDFIDPLKTASAGISPASILNGASAGNSSGTTADDIREDIRTLFQVFIAANNAPTSGVWIMSATTALSLSLMRNPLGQAEFPGISMSGGTFSGLPVIISEYVPTSTAGSIVALVNASDIYLGDEGGFAVDISREASLQIDDAPTQATVPAAVATQVVSLWQTNSVGFRAERTINWARRRAASAVYIGNVNWGA